MRSFANADQIRSDRFEPPRPAPPTPLHVCDGYCAHAADAGGFGQSSWKQRSTQEVRGIGVGEPYVQIGQIRPEPPDQIGSSLPSPPRHRHLADLLFCRIPMLSCIHHGRPASPSQLKCDLFDDPRTCCSTHRDLAAHTTSARPIQRCVVLNQAIAPSRVIYWVCYMEPRNV